MNVSIDVSLCVLLDWATRVYELTTIYSFTMEICHFLLIILLDTQVLLLFFLKDLCHIFLQ